MNGREELLSEVGLTQNRKKLGGTSGRKRADKDILPNAIRLESTGDACILPLRATIDQKAGGSNSSRRAKPHRNQLISMGFCLFLYFFRVLIFVCFF